MMSRTFLAVALFAATATPIFAQAAKTDGPAITVQAQPLGKLLADVKIIVQKVGVADAVKTFDEKLEDALGEKGFTGIDLTRLFGGYVILKDDLEDIGGVVMVPVTNEKDFLALLKRMKVDAELVKDIKGLYELTPPDDANLGDKSVRMRFKNGYAYVGINLEDAELATEKLLAVKDVITPGETSTLAYQTYLQRYSKELKEKVLAQSGQLSGVMSAFPIPEGLKDGLGEIVKYVKRINDVQYKEGDVYTVKLNVDPKTLELSIETGITGLKGTQLAKDITERKPTTNRFAGLVTDQSAGGFKTRLPLFAPEIRAAVEALLKEGEKAGADKVPEEYQPVAKEALQGLLRTVKSGNFDIAAAVIGPDAKGKFGANIGISFEDPSALEKELRKLHKSAPDEVKNLVKLDVAKSGTVSIHNAEVGAFLPSEAKAILGDEASVSFAFAPKGIYVTVGKDSLAQIKAALKTEPAPVSVLDVAINPKRLQKLIAAGNEEAGKQFGDTLGIDDELRSVFAISVEGGSELKIRVVVNLKPIVGAAMGRLAPKD